MNMTRKVLVYSSLNIDCTFSLDHINAPAETQSSTGFRKTAGGKGANQSAALAKAGSNVFFAGKAGEDGNFIIKKLNEIGVNTEFVYHTDSGSGQAIIQLDKNGQNSIILFGGGNQEIQTSEIDEVLKNFSSDDILLLDGEINNTKYILDKAYEKKMTICINPSPVNNEVLSLDLSKATLLVVNEIEGAALSGISGDNYEEICKTLSAKYNNEVVLTTGPNGAYYCCNNELLYYPADKVKVVDTTGAGDTFLGFFITEKNNGKPIIDCLAKANRAASLACTRAGALDAIPFSSEV